MKAIRVLFAVSFLSVSVGCVTQGHRGSQVASASSGVSLPSMFVWDVDRPGKSTSNTHITIAIDGGNFVATSKTDYVVWNVGGGQRSLTFDTAKKTATTTDNEKSVSYDGNSSDPAQVKGYADAMNDVIYDLGIIINSVEPDVLAQRNAIVAKLKALLPAAGASLPASFAWDVDRPGKSSSDTHIDLQISGDDIVAKSNTNYVNWNVGSGQRSSTFDTAKKTATVTDNGKATSYDGSSTDPEQLKGYADAIKGVIYDLGIVINSVDADTFAKRDAIVAKLKSLIPAGN